MTKFVYGLIIFTTLFLVALGAWVLSGYIRPSTQAPSVSSGGGYANNGTVGVSNSNSTNVSTPGSSGVVETPIAVTIPGGKKMSVKDFLNNKETVPDKVNPGYYYLAGSIGYCLGDGSCPSGYKTEDFSITYHKTDGMFTVVLLSEPLSAARVAAETFLADRLGVTPAHLCNLNYWVGTPDIVNPVYAGGNLGFSFCPGNTILP